MTPLLDTFIENRSTVQPNHANPLGTAHGGNVMKWMDEVGALSAMRFAGSTCVTARFDQIDFTRPIPVGETALVTSYVYEAGRTSIRVIVRAARENPRTGNQEPTTESYAVYVAIDEDGRPTPVPELSVSSERGRHLQEEALAGLSERQGGRIRRCVPFQ